MPPTSARWTRLALLLLTAPAAAVAACSDDGTTGPPEAEVEEVVVSPDAASLEALDATVQLEATALDAEGGTVSDVEIDWTSLDPQVATVSGSGLVTAVGEGSTTIRATATEDGVSGDATVTVDQVVTAAEITPTEASVSEGETTSFDATAVDANGNEVADASITWSSDDEAVATVDDQGVATGVSAGTTTIRATTDAGPSAEATLTVTVPVALVEVSPAEVQLDAVDATVQLEATAFDDEDAVIDDVAVEWSSDATGVASVDDQGVVTAHGQGAATITAEADGATGDAVVTVDQVAASAEIEPTEASIEVDETADFTATARDANGNVVADATFTWSSSDPAVATVDETGTATGTAEGSATIRAESADGPFAEANLTVTAATEVSLSIVSGDGQTDGVVTQEFSEPLVVEVTNQDGDLLEGREVTWEVIEGDATLSTTSTTTDAEGRASVTLTSGTTITTHSIEARVEDVTTTPVTFTAETTVMLVEIVDNAFRDLEGRTNTNAAVTVPAGTTVRWVYLSSGASVHTVTSGEGQGGSTGDGVPDGGTAFDSGNLSPGETFEVTLETAGEWTYFCEIHPDIMYNSTVTVTEP